MKKIKKYLLVLFVFVPPAFILFLFTEFFTKPSILLVQILFPTIVLFLSLCCLYHYYVTRPCNSLVKTINRAIHGDYRARFSCRDENKTFQDVSVSFNRLMSIVEKQTNELTENRRLQRLLYENEKIYRSALELTCMRVLEADITHNKLIYGQYKRDFPFIQTEMYDELIKSMSENAVHPDDAQKYYRTFCRQSLKDRGDLQEKGEVCLEYREKNSDGNYIWVSLTMVHMNNKNDNTRTVIGYVKNIDDRKRAELLMLTQSQRDGLTGLYNKRVTQDKIQEYITGVGHDKRHAVIMLDIDNFKGINDTLGHMQGDFALTRVAELLQNLFRGSDIVGRIGGDEFFVMMKDLKDRETLENKLKELCDQLNFIRLGENGDYKMSGSVGSAIYPENGHSYNELYKKADLALYFAKEHGKNGYFIYRSATINSASAPVRLPEKSPIESSRPIESGRPVQEDYSPTQFQA